METLGSVLTGGIGIKGQHHPLGVAAQHPHVFLGQRRATGGHRPTHVHCGETHNVGVSLAHDGLIGGHDGALGPVQSVQHPALVVHGTSAGVFVLGTVGSWHDPAPERNRVSAGVEDGEHDPAPKGISGSAAGVDECQTGINKYLTRKWQCLDQGVPGIRSPAQLVVTHLIAGKAPAAQVLAGCSSVGGFEQPLVVEVRGRRHGLHQTRTLLALVALMAVGVVKGDPGSRSQPLHCSGKVQMVGLAYKGDGIALGPTAKAVVQTLLGVDRKRR